MSETIHESALSLDLSPRIAVTTVVVASPAAAAETIVAQLTIPQFAALVKAAGVLLNGWLAYTIGTNGTACRVRLRQTNVAGTIVSDSGAVTGGHAAGALLVSDEVNGFDAGAGVPVYVLTLQVTGASAASTVTAVLLQATIV